MPKHSLTNLVCADPDSLDVRDERVPYWATLWGFRACFGRSAALGSGASHRANPCSNSAVAWALSRLLPASSVRVSPPPITSPNALKFTQLNGLQIAGIAPAVTRLDWRTPPQNRRYPTLLGADLVYEPRFFDPLIATFDALLMPEGRILFSEPNRILGKPFFDRLSNAGWAFTR